MQKDGKIIAAGNVISHVTQGTSDVLLMRYNRDGSLDKSFGNDGKTVMSFDESDDVSGMVLQIDGKIIISGRFSKAPFSGFNAGVFLCRYRIDGTLDETFGDKGRVTVDFNVDTTLPLGIALQSDGKIFLTGTSNYSQGDTLDFSLIRYHSDGSIDQTFGDGGKVIVKSPESADYCKCVLIQPDGKILIGGRSVPHTGAVSSGPALARLHSNGSLDTAFGKGGKVIVERDFDVRDLALQPDGKIVSAGHLVNSRLSLSNLCVSRWNMDGSPDLEFGSGGVSSAFPGNDLLSHGEHIAVLSDGSLLAGGYGLNQVEFDNSIDVILARFHGSGDPAPVPELTTQPAAAVDSVQAFLSGLVNPNEISGADSLGLGMAHFEYAPEKAVLNSDPLAYLTVPASIDSITGNADTAVTAVLTDLTPNTRYRYRVRALNRRTGIVLSGGDMTFTTASPLTELQKWRREWFDTVENHGTAADDADPDQDGLVNLMEWATGGNPKAGNAAPIALTRNGVQWEFVYTRNVNVSRQQFQYYIEWTTDPSLFHWQSSQAPDHVDITTDGPTRQVRVILPLPDAPRYFVRLRLIPL